jgi:hypothetical protein
MRRFLIFAASLAILPAMVSAQGRGMGRGTISGMARPAMAGQHVAMRGPSTVGIHTTVGTRPVTGMRLVRTRSGAVVLRPAQHVNGQVRNSGSSGAILSQDVPGLGFDFPHFAATHPGRDHDRFRDRQLGGAFIPFFGGGGFFMPLFPEDVEEAPAGEAQQVDTEEAPAARAPRREQVVEPPQSYAAAPQPVPQQESDQYVFVRRDGTLFFAVAYAWENGTLRYITGEGIRRTVTADKLDLDATQQFNEQRGLNFRLPA